MSLIAQQNPAADKTKFALVFSYASFILIGVVNTFLGPILPFLSDKWSINDVQAGYFLAAQSLGGMVGTLITSLLFSKIGSRWILLGGYFLLVFSMLGISGENWGTGLLSSLINGVSIGVVIPTTTLVVSQAARETRASAINILNFFWAFGAIISPLLFFNLTSQTRLHSLLFALVVVCLVVVAFLFKQKNFRLAVGGKQSLLNAGEKLLLFVSARLYAVTVFLQIGVEASMGGWLATYSRRLTGTEFWLLIPALYWTGFLSSRLLSSFYLRRFSTKSLILLGLSLVTGGQILIIAASGINLASIGAIIVGFGTAPIFPTTIAILSAKFEKKAPELISYIFLLSGLSGVIFSWLIGYVAALTGELKIALLIPLVCGVILFALHFFTRKMPAEVRVNGKG